jgi:hypothetical protein
MPTKTDLYRKLQIVSVRKVRGVEHEAAIRVYKESPEGWAFQVRGLLAKANGQPSSVFIIAHANMGRDDLLAVRDATAALVAEADNLVRVHVYERHDDEYHASVVGTKDWEVGRTPDKAIRALLNRKEYAGCKPVVSFGYLGAWE